MDRRNNIISEIYRKGVIEELLKNMGVPKNDIDDLKQEIAIILLEYDEKKIIEMYEKKQLKYFIVQIIKYQYFSNTSPYYKKYKKYYSILDGNTMNKEEQNEDD